MKLTRAVRFLTFGLLLLVIPAALSSLSAAQIGVGISVRIGPPALPVYDQPLCPETGYMWTPGYWAWDDDDGYYWVPGTWVEAPEAGLLWTPGYWGWNDGAYAWNAGYWGPQIGFYGGINYGFGYGGNGFYGGEWRGGQFFYNTAVMHVNTTTITNVYVNRTVIVNNTSHVAFNGGQGGVAVRPTPQQVSYAHETHTPAVAAQMQQREAASKNRALFASANHGRPAVAATAKPGEFSGRGVVTAKAAGGTYHAPAMSPKEARAPAAAGNRTPETRSAESRPAENRPAKRPANNAKENAARTPENHAAKPSTPASSHAKSESAPRTESARSSSERKPEGKPSAAPKARETAPKASAEPHESAAKAAPAPRENSPKATPKPRKDTAKASPPARESAPKASPKPREETAKASAPKESAPKASRAPHPSAPKPEKAEPPKKESAPKEPKG